MHLTFTTYLQHFLMLFVSGLGVDTRRERLEREFSATISAHDAMIRRICLGYTRTPQDLEDLYQDVLVNIWRGLPSFKADSSIRTWIYRITLNTCVSSIRLRSRRLEFSSFDEILEVADNSEHQNELLIDLYECILQLTPIDKAIVMLWLDEYSYDEIADITGLSRNNVATRLHRAKDRLKKSFN